MDEQLAKEKSEAQRKNRAEEASKFQGIKSSRPNAPTNLSGPQKSETLLQNYKRPAN